MNYVNGMYLRQTVIEVGKPSAVFIKLTRMPFKALYIAALISAVTKARNERICCLIYLSTGIYLQLMSPV